MTTTWKAVLGIVLIFIFGFVCGITSTSIYAHRKMVEFLQHPALTVSNTLERRLTHNLNLDSDQKQRIHELFLANLDQRKQLQEQIQPQVRVLNRQTFMEINSVLRPDQREQFHQNLAQIRRRFGPALPDESTNQIGAGSPNSVPATAAPTNAPPAQ
ncbi:MAG: hypothetical protein LV479_01435 [Methylacidiphilales bacterium]|nr:hypothetical protein [Candidatus Methylacidiphilales bacterium]